MPQDPNTRTIRRIHSRNPEHQREDFARALTLVTALDPSLLERRSEADAIVAQLDEIGPKQVLLQIGMAWGLFSLGAITLFAIEAETSLSGDAEVFTHRMNNQDINWPADRFRFTPDVPSTDWTQDRIDLFDATVAAYKSLYPTKVFKTYTVVGYWSGGEVVLTGIIDGQHNVWGGTDETGDGLFAESFEIDGNAADPQAELEAAIAAAYYN